MSLRPWIAALLAVLLVATSAFSARHASAQTANSHSIFRQWLTATNNGDTNGAMQYLGSDFAVTMPDGSQVSGPAAGEQAIMNLGTPITVVSLTATHQMELDVQLQFGAGSATMSAVIVGNNGVIASMTIAGASAGAAPSATSGAAPQATSPSPQQPVPMASPTATATAGS